MEDRLGEGVEIGEDLAALGAEGVRLVEDRGDPALFGEGREGNQNLLGRTLGFISSLEEGERDPEALDNLFIQAAQL